MLTTQESTARPMVNRGAMRLAQGDLESAEALFRQAIAADPANATAHANLGYVLACRERHEEAIAEAEEAITLDPERSAPWAHMGMSLVATERVDEGLTALSRAVRIDPENKFAWDAMGRTLLGLGRPKEAGMAWASALSSSPDDPDLLISLATALGTQDQTAEAVRLLQQAISVAPQLPRAWTQLGVMSLIRKDFGTARDALLTALSLDTANEEARHHLAVLDRVAGSAVQLTNDVPDKYKVAPVEIDCDNRLPLCQAACCRLRFPLAAQDIEEGVVQWTLTEPYLNRQNQSGYCVHCDGATHGCLVYQHRPGVCRSYDCRADRRIWIDFDNRIINPDCLPVAPAPVPSPRSLAGIQE